LPRQPAARLASGFTLLELLVVIVIIGIITSMAVLSVKVLGGDHEMQQEAARLQAILTQAREEAMLLGSDVGLRLDTRGYDFLRYNTLQQRWDFVTDDPLLRARTLPDGLGLRLRLEDREVLMKPRSGADAQQGLLPQVVVQASGDLDPFDIVFAREGTQEQRRLAGTTDGNIELHDDALEHR